MTPPLKQSHLESVRGIAAFAVLLVHLLYAFAEPGPAGVPAGLGAAGPAAAVLLRPVKMGVTPVMVFFALSGVVLTQSYLRTGRPETLRGGFVRRYPRLMLPALAATLVACGMFRVGLHQTERASRALAQDGVTNAWLTNVTPLKVTWGGAVSQGVYGLFFDPVALGVRDIYDVVLWTMQPEFLGSFVALGAMAAFGGHPRCGWLIAGVAGVMALVGWPSLALFPAGAALAWLHHARPALAMPLWVAAGLVAAAAALGGAFPEPPWGKWERALPVFKVRYDARHYCPALGGLLLVAVALFSPHARRVLVWRPFVWLGAISFGLYLAHVPVITSLGTGLYAELVLGAGLPRPAALAAVVAVCVPASLAAGWVAYRLIDRPSVAAARWFGRRVLGPADAG